MKGLKITQSNHIPGEAVSYSMAETDKPMLHDDMDPSGSILHFSEEI